jgi:hypothetical protein
LHHIRPCTVRAIGFDDHSLRGADHMYLYSPADPSKNYFDCLDNDGNDGHSPSSSPLVSSACEGILESQDPEVEQHSSSTLGPMTKGQAETAPSSFLFQQMIYRAYDSRPCPISRSPLTYDAAFDDGDPLVEGNTEVYSELDKEPQEEAQEPHAEGYRVSTLKGALKSSRFPLLKAATGHRTKSRCSPLPASSK